MSAAGFGINKARRTILGNLISQLMSIPVCWDSEPRPQIDPISRALITLRIRSTKSTSEWDLITTDQSSTATRDPGRTITQIAAQRTHTIEVVVESWDPDVMAHELYYKLTTRIYRDRFRAIMHTANIAVATNSDAIDLPKTYDQHSFSSCAGSLEVNSTDLDLVSDDLDTYIDSVNTDNFVPEGP
jgi:hypothetical protein